MKVRMIIACSAWILSVVGVGFVLSRLASDGPATPVYAMTAHGSEKKTIITVPLDSGMEAVVTLDHLTCDLTGYVLNRFTGKFFVQYRYNVASDFRIEQGKTPRFLMAAGRADFRQFSGNERIADGVVYVSEENSGRVVAYGIPWNSQFRASTATPQARSFLPLDVAKTRFFDSFRLD
jgi:hypothetical protein